MSSNKQTFEEKTYKVLTVLQNLNHINAVTITGGEPLLVNNLNHIVETLSNANKIITLYTNGYLLTENFLKTIRNYNLEKIRVSIDSAISDINGRYLDFNKLVMLGNMCTDFGVKFEVGVTIYPGINDTDQHVFPLWSLAEENNYIFSISPYFPQDLGQHLYDLPEQTLRLLFEYRYGMDLITKCKENDCYECSALKNVISILPDGRISPCDNLAGTLISNRSIIDVPMNDIIKTETHFKAFIDHNVDDYSVCKKCEYKTLCNGGCRAIAFFKGDSYGCDTMSFQRIDAFYNKYQFHNDRDE